MWSVFYALVFNPVELLIELSYVFAHKFISNEGITIICTSIMVQVLATILYRNLKRYVQAKKKGWIRLGKYSNVLSFFLPIIMQIPAFVAAYHYYLGLNEIKEKSFYFIEDLAMPANFIPAGVIMFWISSVVFFMLFNLFARYICKQNKGDLKKDKKASEYEGLLAKLFTWEALLLSILIGAIIPLTVVSSSASEFVNTEHGPVYLILINLATAVGIFFLWLGLFFVVLPSKARQIIVLIITAYCGVAYVDAFYFGNGFGTMSALFEYDTGMAYSSKLKLINLIIILVVAMICAFVAWKWTDVLYRIIQLVLVCAILGTLYLGWSTVSQVNSFNKRIEMTRADKDEAIYHLSSNGKNVIVIMLDRAIGAFIPYIFEEKPEIAKMYDGFTYYGNTISFNMRTNYCTPALFGGYEYTPYNSNKRDNVSLKDKQNEALLIMPRLFSDEGYEVTVTDPPYAGNYLNNNDLSIYDSYDNIHAYNVRGTYTSDYSGVFAEPYQKKQESSAFYYSIMRTAPAFIQGVIYNEGSYLSKKSVGVNLAFLEEYSSLTRLKDMTKISEKTADNCLMIYNGATHDIAALSVPDYTPKEGARDRIETLKKYYSTEAFSDLNGTINLDDITQIAHYQSNLASLRAIGEWFDYLREEGCWDNTRIVIVADHGYRCHNFDSMIHEDGLDVEAFNPLLMVKDFGDHGLNTSDEFMTIADVPTITMRGIVNNPVNPYTGNPISSEAKKEPQMVTTSDNYSTMVNNGNTFDSSDGVWYRVTPGDFRDPKNWERVDD